MREPSAPPSSLPRPVVVASQLLIFVIICALLYWGRFVLVPIALAILCAFILHPVVRLFERRRLKRAPAVIIAMALALGSVGGLTWVFGSQLVDLLAEAPKYRENIKEKISGLYGVTSDNTISKFQKTIREVEEEIEAETPAKPDDTAEPSPEEAVPVMVVTEKEFFDLSLDELSPFLNGLFNIALVVILTGLFLYWREDLVERLVGLSGRTRMVVTTNALTDAGSRISRFLALQLTVNVLYAVIASTGLYILGVPYAAVWGGFAGVLRYIPYVGSILGTLSASTAALVLLPGWEPVIYVFLFYCTMDILVNVAEPFIFGNGLGVSVLSVLLSVVVLGWLWGPIGAILATPFALCLVILGEYVPGLSFLSWVMSKRPRLDPHTNFYHRLLRHDYHGASRILASDEQSTNDPVLDIVVPTLEQVVRDAQAGILSSEEEAWMSDALADLAEDSQAAAHNGAVHTGRQDDCSLLVCPPSSPADQAAAEILDALSDRLPARLQVSHRGRLATEIIAELQENPVDALVVVASDRELKRQVRRWRRHLEQAELEIPLVVFAWSSSSDHASAKKSALRSAGATAVTRGLDELRDWIAKAHPSDSATTTKNNPHPVPLREPTATPNFA